VPLREAAADEQCVDLGQRPIGHGIEKLQLGAGRLQTFQIPGIVKTESGVASDPDAYLCVGTIRCTLIGVGCR
jgi:hypothetical protein